MGNKLELSYQSGRISSQTGLRARVEYYGVVRISEPPEQPDTTKSLPRYGTGRGALGGSKTIAAPDNVSEVRCCSCRAQNCSPQQSSDCSHHLGRNHSYVTCVNISCLFDVEIRASTMYHSNYTVLL